MSSARRVEAAHRDGFELADIRDVPKARDGIELRDALASDQEGA